MKYIISIHEGTHADYIVGGSYIFQSEKYAILTESKEEAKRYSSYGRASAALKKLCISCVNMYDTCKIEEVEE